MTDKMTSAIEKIFLDGATFKNTGTTIVPSYINFFFGRNGAGKSTLAETIASDGGAVAWRDGVSRADYDVLVYNQEFIDRNFSSYGNLAGVITIHEQNIEVQEKIEQKKKEKAEVEAAGKQLRKELEEKMVAKGEAAVQFQKLCWNNSVKIREDFKEALKGKLRSQQFMETVLSAPAAVNHDYDELKKLYDIAFSMDSRTYRLFGKIDSVSTYGTLSGRELLDKAVVSSSGSPFSQFIKALNATDWVRQGHDHYAAHASGKCPYCQQTLPAGFEEEIAACFDAQYQQNIADLRRFEAVYKRETAAILERLNANMQDVLPDIDLGGYTDKLALLDGKIKMNIQCIESKIKEPTSIVALEDTDSILLDLGQIIDEINRQITANNSIVSDKRKMQEQCRHELWEMIAFLLKAQTDDYRAAVDKFNHDIKGLEQSVANAAADYRRITGEIQALNKQGVNTEEAIENINRLLYESGFQGFQLKPKLGVKDTYEVIRSDGKPATRLSEGERNFISFLYFCQLVRGNGKAGSGGAAYRSPDGAPQDADTRDKIVVIDDPVSNMDSNALFVVSTIVRGMIAVCSNNTEYRNSDVNGDYIKQIFILTHNAHFHNEITQKQAAHYSSTSFFVIRKTDNKSTVVPCVRPSQIAGKQENYNPVQNSYAALWDELKKLYKEQHSSIAIKNVSRRILNYYFQGLCGFDGADIRMIVLEANKRLFVTEEGGEQNYDKYHLASALLRYVENPSDIGNEVLVDEDCLDGECHKAVFALIFKAMEQEKHYKMMMNES